MEYKVRTLENVTFLNITGSLDRYSSGKVQDWLDRQAASQPGCVIVNMEGVTHLDSSGLSTLVTGLKRFRSAGSNLSLCSLPNQIRILFELTRLHLAFDIYPTETAAIQAFEKNSAGFAGHGLPE